MSQVISFESYTPAARYDAVSWSEVRIEEAAALGGPYTQIDVVALTPDANPATPAARSFTTANASDYADLWYRLIFADATGDTLAPLFPVQNSVSRPHYATVEELAQLLNIRDVSGRRDELERVLAAAASEIDYEIGLTEPYASPPALVVQVNIERAFELWQAMTTSFGAIGLGADSGPSFVAADTWRRYAEQLSFLKIEWGIA